MVYNFTCLFIMLIDYKQQILELEYKILKWIYSINMLYNCWFIEIYMCIALYFLSNYN